MGFDCEARSALSRIQALLKRGRGDLLFLQRSARPKVSERALTLTPLLLLPSLAATYITHRWRLPRASSSLDLAYGASVSFLVFLAPCRQPASGLYCAVAEARSRSARLAKSHFIAELIRRKRIEITANQMSSIRQQQRTHAADGLCAGIAGGKCAVPRQAAGLSAGKGAKSAVPGSAAHARLATNKARAAHGSTHWSSASSSSTTPTTATSAPRPYSVPSSSSRVGGGKAPPKVTTPALPA